MLCFFCYADSPPSPDLWAAGWDLILMSPVCPACRERARAEHGPGWMSRARDGCYAGGRIDPRRFNPALRGGEIPALGALLGTLDRVQMLPVPDLPDRAYGEIVYHPAVPRGQVVVFGGTHAGGSGVIYRDAQAHLEARIAARLRSIAAWNDAAFGQIATATHRHLDKLEKETDQKLDRNHLRLGHHLTLAYHALTGRFLGDRGDYYDAY